jgi:tripartite-type tricarboxylate transporter receptor subunit TctC
VGPKLSEAWKQPVIVDNRPGANAVIGTDLVAKSPADGYTLLIALGTHVISPHLIATPYHAVNDFAAVATLAAAELGLILNNSVPANSLQEFIALAKAKPGALNYATTQIGGNQHVAGELFALLTGAKLTAIPYKGGGEAMSALLGGHVQAYFGSIASLAPVMKSGKAKGIAVSGEKRHALVPEVPTFSESGVKDFDVRLWYAMLAPAGTPKDVVDRIGAQVVSILAAPDFQASLAKQGLDPFVTTPPQFSTLLKKDFDRYAEIVKKANIKVEQ